MTLRTDMPPENVEILVVLDWGELRAGHRVGSLFYDNGATEKCPHCDPVDWKVVKGWRLADDVRGEVG